MGLLYSAFAYYTGFKVNSGEYKVMGLAPYGQPKIRGCDQPRAVDLLHFNYLAGLTMTSNSFAALFGGPPFPKPADTA